MKERKNGISTASIAVVAIVLLVGAVAAYNLLERGASSVTATSALAAPNTPFQASGTNTTSGCDNPPGTCVIDAANGCPEAGPIQVSAGQRCVSIPATIQVVITPINSSCVGNDYLLVQVPSGVVNYEAVWIDQYGSRWWSSPGTTYPNSITGEGEQYSVPEGYAGWSVGGGASAAGDCTGPPGGTDAMAWAISNSTVFTSTSSSAPPTPPPVVPGIGLSTIEIAAIISALAIVIGGLGWYYYQNSGDGGDTPCPGGGPPPSPGGGCTVSCTPCLPVSCGHATRTLVTTSCLVTVSGPTVECAATCSQAPTCCAPPDCYGSSRARRDVITDCCLGPISRAPVSGTECGTATGHRTPESVCSPIARAQCTPSGPCGSAHATREVCTTDSLTTVCGPSSCCSDALTGRATRTPEPFCGCIPVVSGPSAICPGSGEGTAHRCVQCGPSCLTRARSCGSARATRCCQLCGACVPKVHAPSPCGTGTAVRQPESTNCQPLSRASCGPVSSCGAAHGTRDAVTCGGSCVPIVKSPATGQAVRCSTICAQTLTRASCSSGTGRATRTSCVPSGCQAVAKVKQPAQCGTSTATRTPCSSTGSIKVVKQPSCSGSQSSSDETGSCSSTAEDIPPACA